MTFDANTFMQQSVDAPMSSEFPVVPDGEYRAMIGEINAECFDEANWTDKKSGEAKSAPTFRVPFIIDDPELEAKMGRQPQVRMQTFLDLDSNGALSTAEGKNIKLGQLRKAVGQNSGSWNPGMLSGAGPVMVRVTSREGKEGQRFNDIKSVAPLR